MPVFLYNTVMSCLPVGLVAEFLENPLCLETPAPRLSWRLDDARAGARQTACRIAAASSAARLEAGDHDLWDTGRVMSAETLDIRYAGKRLPSRASVFWRVIVWDKDGKPSPWSAIAHFEIGPFAPGDIAAEWIGSARPRDKAGLPVPMFRKAFTLPAAPVKARLYASAFGDLAMSVNGSPAGADLFVPGWTDYRKRVPLVAWDVAPLLRAGENVLGAMLADGWFAGTMVWPDHRCHYGKRTAFLAQLEVEFADGTKQIVVSDDSWRYTERGPVRDADHYNGETYDARLEMPGWDAPGFAARGWRRAAVVEDRPHPALCGRIAGPV
ncbi:MAG: alpha-L-rhamnosidase N-terminal domain-containing protein, partial [Kiritimatiellae bacterium]|nr:alpha-L-rhamnosidase N-terminal domain-containing protein [Kiritimatiellia bacterium]